MEICFDCVASLAVFLVATYVQCITTPSVPETTPDKGECRFFNTDRNLQGSLALFILEMNISELGG
jgi:hypothetical protein